ncbi:hypothetical protein [Phaffia rhodozyma]|uniref:feruloyl esterase n=1 Tax=Phaffia rhodozyma TaxID=264483 RepID=A0A0F7SH06_PHARH|nr:hypothetical protein [Phaffia rhodozyma]
MSSTMFSAVIAAIFLTQVAQASNSAFYYSSSGCNAQGLKLDSTGHLNRTLPSGRTYLLHVPSNYDSNASHPLVLSFHGAGGTSANQEKLSQFSVPGIAIGGLPVIAAYPQGADNTAEKRTGVWYSAPYANTTVDDVQFAKDVVADISSHYCINPVRVYASGKSNGGGFTAYLACRPDTSTLFAAFAPVSPVSPALYNGTLAFSGCDPSRPVPIINSHGVVDQTIPFEGRNVSATGDYGVGTATINVSLWRRQWAIRNGCYSNGSLPDPTYTIHPYPNATEEVWQCNAVLEAFTTSDLGHSWPTTLGLDSSGAPNNTASYNLTNPSILDFFSVNTLPIGYLK